MRPLIDSIIHIFLIEFSQYLDMHKKHLVLLCFLIVFVHSRTKKAGHSLVIIKGGKRSFLYMIKKVTLMLNILMNLLNKTKYN